MNFLAHAFLAGEDPALIVGGVAGDWIKGPLPGRLPADLARGVALHRAIDRFADEHPAFRASRSRISAARRRYSGVLVDIYYDHLLAAQWPPAGKPALTDYCRTIYRMVAERSGDLPETALPALRRMAAEDWLASYARLDGIADILQRMSRHARQPNPLAGGEAELVADMAGFDQDFRRWLPDAQDFASRWRAGHAD